MFNISLLSYTSCDLGETLLYVVKYIIYEDLGTFMPYEFDIYVATGYFTEQMGLVDKQHLMHHLTAI